jgi:hypothetical protein
LPPLGVMPCCIQCDLEGREHCSHVQDGTPFNVNDVDFARNNRLFCDFLHRGIVRDDVPDAPEGGERAIEYA